MELGIHRVRAHWNRVSRRYAAGGERNTRLVKIPTHRQYHKHRP